MTDRVLLLGLGGVVGFVLAWLLRGWDVYVWETRTRQLEADWQEYLGFPHWLPREKWIQCWHDEDLRRKRRLP